MVVRASHQRTTSRTRRLQERVQDALNSLDLHSGVKAHGQITFAVASAHGVVSRQPAHFALLDVRQTAVDAMHKVLQSWKLKRPAVILSISGSAQGLNIPSYIKDMYQKGITAFVQSTEAWVITPGTDAGVSTLTSRAVSRAAHINWTPVIGIAAFQKVTHRERVRVRDIEHTASRIRSISCTRQRGFPLCLTLADILDYGSL